MNKSLHRSRTLSCPIPYIPDSAHIREENAARDAETNQDRAALEFALKLQQRRTTRRSLRASTTAVPLEPFINNNNSNTEKDKKPIVNNNQNLINKPKQKTNKFDLSLDLSGLSFENENKESTQVRNATMSARDFLQQRQKKAIQDRVRTGVDDIKIGRTKSACV